MKKCLRCKAEIRPDQFNKNRDRADGLQTCCKACQKAMHASYYVKTKATKAQAS